MARARNIKPGFFANEDLAECSFPARLCFAGLWTLADREGRLEDRPKRIKGELFRFDSIEVEPLLEELAGRGFLVRYQNSDGSFIQVSKFSTHQTPHYSEKPSVIKPPQLQESDGDDDDETPRGLQEDSKKPGAIKGGSQPPDSLIPDSLIPDSLIPDSGKEQGSAAPPHGAAPPTPTTSKASPPANAPPPDFDGNNAEALNGKAVVAIAAGWELPEQWGMDAEALGFRPAEVLREAEKFRQYWVAGKGTGTRRSVKGWRQSWSNWLGKAAGDQR